MPAVRPGVTGGQPVSVLRETDRPDQGAVLHRGWICVAVQAVEQRSIPMAEECAGASAAGCAELSLVDGGAEDRPAEGDPKVQDKGFILNKSWTICGFYDIILS